MATVKEQIERATKLLQLLPPKERKLALNYIEDLAFETDVDLQLAPRIEEDLALIKRVRSGDYSGTVTLDEACREFRASRAHKPSE